jgi:hypothetical protein
VRSAWEDPPPKPAEQPASDSPSPSPSPDGPDAASQAAFDPTTGEINWDCPCLGGMAHGPCGPEFREAFSCFIYSEEEPKGINCVEKFKGMQDCFRAHPDVYGEGNVPPFHPFSLTDLLCGMVRLEIDNDDEISHNLHEGASLDELVKEAEAALTPAAAEPNPNPTSPSFAELSSSSSSPTPTPNSKSATKTKIA